jgi:O-antigen/teichoic acid export membrane protein
MIKRIINTSIYSILSRGFITGTNLFIIYFISRNLNKEALGVYGIVFFFFQFFSAFSSMNLYLFFGKELAYKRGDKIKEFDIFNEFLSATIIGSLISFLLMFIGIFFYTKISPILLFLSFLSGLLLGMEKNLGGMLLGKEKMNLEFISNFSAFLFIFTPIFSLPERFDNIEKIFILRIITLIIIVSFKLFILRGIIAIKPIKIKLKFFKEEKFYWFSSLSNLTIRQIDVLILSFFIGKVLLGDYFLAVRIYLAFGILAEVISYALTPFISRLFKGIEKTGFKEFSKKGLIMIVSLAFFSSIILFFSRNLLLGFFDRASGGNSSTYLIYFSLFIFFRFITYFTGITMTSTGFQNIRFYINLLSSILIIVLDIILGYLWSVKGVIIARGIVELIMFLGSLYFFIKIIKNHKISKTIQTD